MRPEKKVAIQYGFKNFMPYLIRFLVLGCILTAVTLLTYFLSSGMERSIVAGLNGLTISSVIGLVYTLFAFMYFYGYLNFVSYGFSSMSTIFSKNATRKYKDLHEYNEIKKRERHGKTHYFLAYLVASGVFVIALIVVYIIQAYTPVIAY